MLRSLSKDEISRLPAEQQEALGRSLLENGAVRRKLLARAKGDRGSLLFSVVILFAVPALWAWTGEPTAVIVMMSVWILGHVIAVNSRIDSLVELLDFDRERGDSFPRSNDE